MYLYENNRPALGGGHVPFTHSDAKAESSGFSKKELYLLHSNTVKCYAILK